MNGKKIITYDMTITDVIDSGTSFEDILSGKKEIPLQGVRIFISFEGKVSGEVTGTISGVDYVYLRSDGRAELDIRAMIQTADDDRIAVVADGVANIVKGESRHNIYENVKLTTSAEKYQILNLYQVWSVGYVDFETKKLVLEGYLQD